MDTNAENKPTETKVGSMSKVKSFIPYFIRILTIPPLMALMILSIMYIHGGMFENVGQYLFSVLFLTVLPISAYPLQKLLPHFRDAGRSGQRTLAMIMSVAGYLLGIVYALALDVSRALLTLFLTYLISGIVLLVVNKLFGIKASGHSCGLMGPVGALVYFIGWPYLVLGAVLMSLVAWGSLKMKRHTPLQLIIGGCIPVAAFYILAAILL